MSDDLVKMLRHAGWLADYHGWGSDTIYCRAANHIEAQAARIAALEAALSSIARNTCCDMCQEAALVARAALEGEKL